MDLLFSQLGGDLVEGGKGQGGLEGFLQAGRELKVKGLMDCLEGMNELDTFATQKIYQKETEVAPQMKEPIFNQIVSDKEPSKTELVSYIHNDDRTDVNKYADNIQDDRDIVKVKADNMFICETNVNIINDFIMIYT